MKDCPLLESVARGVAEACAGVVPVTAKIRIGWDGNTVNAVEVCKRLEDCGMQAVAVHGRTRSQGYGGEACWETIDACARAVGIPVVGNGDISNGEDVARRRRETAVSGVMIGRAAMQNPWVFQEAKHFLMTGEQAMAVSLEERWRLVLRHCRMAAESRRYGAERHAIMAMRSRLMAYCKGFPGAKELRQRLARVESVAAVEEIAEWSLAHAATAADAGNPAE